MIDWIRILSRHIIISAIVVDTVAPKLPAVKQRYDVYDWRYSDETLIETYIPFRGSNLYLEITDRTRSELTSIHVEGLNQWGVRLRIIGYGKFTHDKLPSLKSVAGVGGYKIKINERQRVEDNRQGNDQIMVVLVCVEMEYKYHRMIRVYLEFKWDHRGLSYSDYYAEPISTTSSYVLTNDGYYRLQLDLRATELKLIHEGNTTVVKGCYQHLIYSSTNNGFVVYLGDSFAGIVNGNQFYHYAGGITKSYGFVLDREFLVYIVNETLKVYNIVEERGIFSQPLDHSAIPLAYAELYNGVLAITDEGISVIREGSEKIIYRPKPLVNTYPRWNNLEKSQWLSNNVLVAQFRNTVRPIVAFHVEL